MTSGKNMGTPNDRSKLDNVLLTYSRIDAWSLIKYCQEIKMWFLEISYGVKLLDTGNKSSRMR